MKRLLLLTVAIMSLTLHAAEETKFITVPLEQASGAKALASISTRDAFSEVPQGRQTFGGVPFDVLTKLQLAGNTDSRDGRLYVARSLGIAVGEKLARLHVLHAANIPGHLDQPIASLRLHYANGATQTLVIIYGTHVRNFYKDGEVDTLTDTNSSLVWSGRRPTSSGTMHCVFKSTFNLRSDSPLDHIDAFSLFGKSSLAIFGMTGELADGATSVPPTPSSDDSRYRNELTVKVLQADGTPVPYSKVRGIAFDATNAPITLGQMDDTATEAGIAPVDFPAHTRELRLVVTARGFVPSELVLTATPGEGFNRNITVRLDRGTRIGGIVTNPDGSPVEKAKVGVFRATRDAAGKLELFRYAEPTTDKRGRWAVYETPESLENLRFQVTHPDYRELAVDFSGEGTGTLTRKALLSSKAELKFERAPTISGTVHDTPGQPLAGIQVTLVRTNAAKERITAQIRTDAQGRFAFPEIESSRARLFVNDPRFAPAAYLIKLDQPPAPLDITLTTGKPLKLRAVESPTRLNPEIGPSLPGATFTVVDAGGVPFWNTRADNQGEAVWEKPLQHSSEATNGVEGKILVRADGVGLHRGKSTWVDPNAGEALIKMERWIPWKIRAIDAETKQPILNFTTLNARPPTFADKFGPSRSVNGEALGGYFAETFIHERVLTIEAEGYETLRFQLMPELGATNTYELKRK